MQRKFVLFYAAYFLKCLEERVWWFCLVTSLAELGSLGYLAGEQLLEGLLQVAMSTYLGTMIDKYSRKRGLITILLLNNFTFLAALSSLIARYSLDAKSPWSLKLLLLTMLFSIFGRLFLNAEKNMLGKDWLLVIRSDSKLSSLNWYLQLVDQAANIIAPIYSGWLLTNISSGIWLLGLTLVFTMSGRSLLLGLLYSTNESLAAQKHPHSPSRTHSSPLRTFTRQEAFLAALGACLLFMTVMGFGSVAVGYATKAKVPKDTIGYLRALAAVMSLGGGGLYAVLERTTSANTAGIVGLILHQTAIIVVVGSVFLPGSSMNLEGYFGSFTFENWWQQVSSSFNKARSSETESDASSWSNSKHTSIQVFLIASAFTLIGQSCLETSIKHIMQVSVPDTERNTVFGVQNSISKGFTMLKDFMVIGLQPPAIFPILIFTSYAFVSTGHLFFVWYVMKSRSGRKMDSNSSEVVTLNNEEEKPML